MVALCLFDGNRKQNDMPHCRRHDRIEDLSASYMAKVARPWFGPREKIGLAIIYASIVLVLFSVMANSLVRHMQLSAWQDKPQIFLIDGAPTFSTTDAPFFLLHAESAHQNTPFSSVDSIRLFPNVPNETATTQTDNSATARPLLALLINMMAVQHDPAGLLNAGNRVIILTAGLTALMIAICFGAAGYWLEGAAAGVGGGLSMAYLTRTAIGRIDTDQLNLGFMYLLFGLLVFAGKARSRTWSLAFCVAAGTCAKLFMWWYYKPELMVVVAVMLAITLICLQRDILTAIIGTLTFLVLADIGFFSLVESPYFKEVLSKGSFIFPHTFQTITELQHFSLPQILTSATGSMEMGLVGLTGLALFTFRHPILALVYGPLVGFGLLNFLVGNRAIFYAAPILWFGVAFLLTTLGRYIAASLSRKGDDIRLDHTAAIIGGCLCVTVAWVHSPTSYVPRPSFPKPVIAGLASLKTVPDPANAVVATWWDYGYASMFFNGLPTLHDGGLQATPTTHFVADALLKADIFDSIGTLKFLSTSGHKGINAEISVAGLSEAIKAAATTPSPDLYFAVTNQMAGWMGSISKIGNWDIERGQPIQLRGNPDGAQVHYKPMNCRFTGYPHQLTCAGVKIDLERGLIDGAPLLLGWTHTQNGRILRRRQFEHDADHAVQIVQNNGRIGAYLLHRQLYESTFNELYHLGVADHPSISLHYDDYPHIRIYRIDGNARN